MAKKIDSYIKLQVPAGKANPSPPIGPALGQRGVNIMEFCKAFNAATQNAESGLMMRVKITVYVDKTFTFVVSPPPASVLIKKMLNLASGSSNPNTKIVANISLEQLKAIAQSKLIDLTAVTEKAALRTIAGTARSMGVMVEDISELE